MKPAVTLLVALLLLLALPACSARTRTGESFDPEAFPAAYNEAARQTGATQIPEQMPGSVTAYQPDGSTVEVEDIYLLEPGIMESGSLLVQQQTVTLSGEPADAARLLEEYTAVVMACAGLDQAEAKTLVGQLLAAVLQEEAERSSHTVETGGYRYVFQVEETVYSLTVSPVE